MSGDEKEVRVWDIAVRVFHWSLLVAFLTAYVTSSTGPQTLHEIAGYTVMALVLFRIVWGFIGSHYARFREFVRSPAEVITYVKSLRAGHPVRYLGHNPLGACMVLALLAMLLATTLAGNHLESIKEAADTSAQAVYAEAHGGSLEGMPRRASLPEERQWKEIHETLVNLVLALVLLHVLGVYHASKAHGENLAQSMVTGYKKSR